MLLLHVSPDHELPLYRQIMRQVTDAIASGQLAPGDQLPPHRDLSEQLTIAPLTVKKAYDELEKLGYVTSSRGRGTFVADSIPAAESSQRQARIHEAAQALLREAFLGGLSLDQVLTLIRTTAHDAGSPDPARLPHS